MTKSQAKSFRNILEANLIELGGRALRRDAIAVETAADDLDRTLRASERDLAVHTLEAASVGIRAIRAALQRMDDGTFGICLECDDEISLKRLTALPAASLCIECQEAADSGREARPRRMALPMAA
ncbi:TraR/DksA family transcriptional regulator [Paludibaculum fermentans]|uniref:TraR/DksA family transcriptional regulator n=1 Tax=Paludibaculum fermentans TaxID=1473598 RepID=UPI003EC00E5B